LASSRYEEPGLGPLVQSNAIVRYLAKKHGYNGSNDLQRSHYGAPAERFRAADERSQVPTLHGWSHPYLTGQLLGVPSQY